MKNLLCMTAIATAVALPAAAQTDTPIENVDVSFELSAIESPAAAQFWAQLEGDLETAIIERVATQTADEGSKVQIDIDEFMMSNSFAAALGEESAITADIEVTNDTDPTKNSFYQLTVTLAEAGGFEPTAEGVAFKTIPEDVAYKAMIDTFAESVVTRLR